MGKHAFFLSAACHMTCGQRQLSFLYSLRVFFMGAVQQHVNAPKWPEIFLSPNMFFINDAKEGS
jgi:hypothetical protein